MDDRSARADGGCGLPHLSAPVPRNAHEGGETSCACRMVALLVELRDMQSTTSHAITLTWNHPIPGWKIPPVNSTDQRWTWNGTHSTVVRAVAGGSSTVFWKRRNRSVTVTGDTGESQSTVPLKVAWRRVQEDRILVRSPESIDRDSGGPGRPTKERVMRHDAKAHRRLRWAMPRCRR